VEVPWSCEDFTRVIRRESLKIIVAACSNGDPNEFFVGNKHQERLPYSEFLRDITFP